MTHRSKTLGMNDNFTLSKATGNHILPKSPLSMGADFFADQNKSDEKPLLPVEDSDTGKEEKKKIKPAWDSFKLPKIKVKRSSDQGGSLAIPLKLLKTLCYLVTAGLVLSTVVLSNVSLFLMTSQIPTNRTMDLCQNEANKRFTVHTPPTERAGWLFALWLCLVVPEVILLLESIWICIFKSYVNFKLYDFFILFVTETCQAAGLSLLVFSVFTRMNTIRALMLTNTLGLIPALLLPISRNRSSGWGWGVKVVMDLLAAACIATCVALWSLDADPSWNAFHRYIEVPLAVLLTSIGWWENFYISTDNL